MNASRIVIDGETRQSRSFSREELASLPAAARITDISSVATHRQGEAVRLAGLLDESPPEDSATHVTLHSADGFSASLPLADVRDTGLILFQLEGQALPDSAGGPFRFLIPDAAACRTAELDACANVKKLVRIELTTGKGRDTRYEPARRSD
ncbi:MAG: molybdopterin-dependent oxidoreductase [Planctomycetota bacterium]|nr:molybdopterin-dependent oxidoreductase [Planctomycetota bacterium]